MIELIKGFGVLRDADFKKMTASEAFSYSKISNDNGDFSIFFGQIKPGEYIPPHVHPEPCDTYVIVTAGKVVHRYGPYLKHKIKNRPGDVIHIHSNMPHQPICDSTSEKVESLIICNYDQTDTNNAIPYDPSKDEVRWDLRGLGLEQWSEMLAED